MYPRLPRLLRLAIFAVGLSLSLLLILRAGGGHQGNPDLLRPSPSRPHLAHLRLQHGAQLTAMRHTQSTPPKLLEKAYGASKTLPPTTAPITKAITTTMKAEEVVNPHPFSYLINPRNNCRTALDGHVDMLVYVHSAPANFKKRMSIRQTWGDRGVLQGYNASLVFLMGMVPDAAVMDLLKMESNRYGDIVQEDFLDSYRNLTYKAIAGLRWASAFCSRVTYILKTDDDILVNLPRVVRYIYSVVKPQFGTERLILCNQWVRMKIIRDVKSKWYVPETELKGEFFSPYCSGSAFILSGDMAGLMYKTSLTAPFFWVDDFYITGTLVQRLQVKHRPLNKAYSLNPGVAEGKFRNDTKQELFFFHLHKLLQMYRLWGEMNPAPTSSPFLPQSSPREVKPPSPDSVLAVPRAA